MGKKKLPALSRREREIMDIIYEKGEATVSEVLENLSNPPSYSAVRATLKVLEDKGHLKHKQRGPSYLYVPTLPKTLARRSALRHLVQTFFAGSVEQAVSTLLDTSADELSQEELDRLAEKIEEAKKEGR